MRMLIFCKFLIIGFLLTYSNLTFSQEKSISENEVSFEILKWHYHHYPNSSNTIWKTIGQGTNVVYRCEFEFEANKIVSSYNQKGILLSEEVDMKDKVPVSLTLYLDDLYSKYKITSFFKITSFLSPTEKKVVYEMGVREKELGNILLNFDENMIPYPDNLLSEN